MIAIIINAMILGVAIAFIAALFKYRKLEKLNGEITSVEVKSIKGMKITFAVHYGCEVNYEVQYANTKRAKFLMRFVEE